MMIDGITIHDGMILSIEGKIYKVISSELRGAAKAQKIMHAGLKSIPEGHYVEKKINPGEKVEQIIPERFDMEYMYKDTANYYFMNTQTYEQFPVPKGIVGNIDLYLKENTAIKVEFYNGQPINIVFPKWVELKIISSPPGIHDGTDTTYKEVVLENNQKVLGPQFLKEGDIVRVDVETGKYLERVRKDGEKEKK
jgi:elongation factor P